jgi:hypothetical protein
LCHLLRPVYLKKNKKRKVVDCRRHFVLVVVPVMGEHVAKYSNRVAIFFLCITGTGTCFLREEVAICCTFSDHFVKDLSSVYRYLECRVREVAYRYLFMWCYNCHFVYDLCSWRTKIEASCILEAIVFKARFCRRHFVSGPVYFGNKGRYLLHFRSYFVSRIVLLDAILHWICVIT